MKFPAFEPINLKNNVDAFSVQELYLFHICSNTNQPRRHFEENALQELALSIKQHGVIQPIIVKRKSDEKYEIIAGERRWRASQLAGLEVIPAIIQENEAEKNIAISLIENIQREQLNPIELAQAFHKLSNEYHLSHEAIAIMIGKRRTTITNLLRLLNLSSEVQELLILGKIEMGHARALLPLSKEQQNIFAKKILDKNLSVRDIERLVQSKKKEKDNKPSKYAGEVKSWEKKLSHSLSAKVVVNINEKGEGRVVIHFSSPGEVDWLVEHLIDSVEV